MRKKILIIITIELALLVFVLGFLFGLRKVKNRNYSDEVSDETDIASLFPGFNGDTVYYTDDVYFYRPTSDHIVFNKEKLLFYLDNMIAVYLTPDVSHEEREEIAESVDGSIVGESSGALNLIQIEIKAADLETISEKVARLNSLEHVILANVSAPSLGEVYYKQSKWEPNMNIQSPDGDNWWAEAVDAYQAWALADEYSRVKLGILDNGFDSQHEDFEGNLLVQSDICDKASHGTHCAGLMCAVDNEVGIRGICDGAEILAMDLDPNDKSGSIEEAAAMLPLLVEKGAKVVNQSYGSDYNSAFYFYTQFGLIFTYGDYANFLESNFEWIIIYSEKIYATMYSMHCSGYDDYLVVQSAGNGENDRGPGVDSNWSGYYNSIRPWTYKLLMDQYEKQILSENLTYDYFRDHIITVGSVENRRDNNGNYYMAYLSNYNVDLCAPGHDVFSLSYKKRKKNYYENKSGTSMAAPIVSGSAGLLWSVNPDLTYDQVKYYLLHSTIVDAIDEDYLEADSDFAKERYPMLNVGQAVSDVIQDMYLVEDMDVETPVNPNWWEDSEEDEEESTQEASNEVIAEEDFDQETEDYVPNNTSTDYTGFYANYDGPTAYELTVYSQEGNELEVYISWYNERVFAETERVKMSLDEAFFTSYVVGGHGINGDFDFYLTFDKDDETVSMYYVDPYADQSAEMILRKQ